MESSFTSQVSEVAVITGAMGWGGVRHENLVEEYRIKLIAWRNLQNQDSSIKKDAFLYFYPKDEKELAKIQDAIKPEKIYKLQVRANSDKLLFVQILSSDYKDSELELLLTEYLKPVFYEDAELGKFEKDRAFNEFINEIDWLGEKCRVSCYVDDKNSIKTSIDILHKLMEKQFEWDEKIKNFAVDSLYESSEKWHLEDGNSDYKEQMSRDFFKKTLLLNTIAVEPNGNINFWFSDQGILFFGHSIYISANINGELLKAKIYG